MRQRPPFRILGRVGRRGHGRRPADFGRAAAACRNRPGTSPAAPASRAGALPASLRGGQDRRAAGLDAHFAVAGHLGQTTARDDGFCTRTRSPRPPSSSASPCADSVNPPASRCMRTCALRVTSSRPHHVGQRQRLAGRQVRRTPVRSPRRCSGGSPCSPGSATAPRAHRRVAARRRAAHGASAPPPAPRR